MKLLMEPEAPPLKQWLDGSIRIGASRIPLERLVLEFNKGATPEEFQQDFETLELRDIYGAIAFYLAHKTEVDEYVRARTEVADRLMEQAMPNEIGIRQRLLSRQNARGLNVAVGS